MIEIGKHKYDPGQVDVLNWSEPVEWFQTFIILRSWFVLPHFFSPFCMNKVAVRDWRRARISDDAFNL